MGDLSRMCADSQALSLAAEAVHTEGLTSFQQVIARAEAVKRARCSIYPPLAIGVEYSSAPGQLTREEFFALIREFYGELSEGEMETIRREGKSTRAVIDEHNVWQRNRYARNKQQQMGVAI